MNPATGKRRYQARRIADQENASAPEGRHRSAGGNEAAAPLHDMQAVEPERVLHAIDERIQLRLAAAACGNADLRRAMSRHHPADVTRRQLAVGKAMQE